MANECDYEMTAVSRSRKALERLVKIMKYQDPEYFLYRVFDADLIGNIEVTADGFFVARIEGTVAWSCATWFTSDERTDSIHAATGSHYITLDLLCRRLGIGVEVYGEEYDCGFQEYHKCNHAGVLVLKTCADWCQVWHDDEGKELKTPIEKGGLADYGVYSAPAEIYGSSEPAH